MNATDSETTQDNAHHGEVADDGGDQIPRELPNLRLFPQGNVHVPTQLVVEVRVAVDGFNASLSLRCG